MIARSTSPENSSTETPAKSHIVLESFKSRPFCILCLLTLSRNAVSCLCFDTDFRNSFGHQDEILAIDALRKERALTLGRDRTMLLHKMSETCRTIYRAPASSLESCCFISDTEYLSGSDKNALLKKKPVLLLKNAHSVVAGGITTNGLIFLDIEGWIQNRTGSSTRLKLFRSDVTVTEQEGHAFNEKVMHLM
ncbi:hypothetical protein Bca52824_031330 [Brassica carinata]|uniref:Uncharacterized protein n=1 Tax=Brassica carinata TaxID=52824 RepID=A0A8X7SEU9_BRACI|nr:hypothetical protein Bca52824_031330 [Brassica carinata]